MANAQMGLQHAPFFFLKEGRQKSKGKARSLLTKANRDLFLHSLGTTTWYYYFFAFPVPLKRKKEKGGRKSMQQQVQEAHAIQVQWGRREGEMSMEQGAK